MGKRLYLEPLSSNGVTDFLKVGIKLSLQETNMKRGSVCYLLHDGYLLGLLFDHENAHHMFLQNISRTSTDCTVLYPRRSNYS